MCDYTIMAQIKNVDVYKKRYDLFYYKPLRGFREFSAPWTVPLSGSGFKLVSATDNGPLAKVWRSGYARLGSNYLG